MKKVKQINTVYLVAMCLLSRKNTYIHNLKTECKANNPMQRISSLRNKHGWLIKTVDEGMKNGVKVFHYEVVEKGRMPKRFR